MLKSNSRRCFQRCSPSWPWFRGPGTARLREPVGDLHGGFPVLLPLEKLNRGKPGIWLSPKDDSRSPGIAE